MESSPKESFVNHPHKKCSLPSIASTASAVLLVLTLGNISSVIFLRKSIERSKLISITRCCRRREAKFKLFGIECFLQRTKNILLKENKKKKNLFKVNFVFVKKKKNLIHCVNVAVLFLSSGYFFSEAYFFFFP